MTRAEPHSSSGFTLIEVVVSFAILTVGLTVLLAIFSNGPRWAHDNATHRMALLLAESKLAEILAESGLSESVRQGRLDNGMIWRGSIERFGNRNDYLAMRVLKVSVAVAAKERAKEPLVTLTTLYLEPQL